MHLHLTSTRVYIKSLKYYSLSDCLTNVEIHLTIHRIGKTYPTHIEMSLSILKFSVAASEFWRWGANIGDVLSSPVALRIPIAHNSLYFVHFFKNIGQKVIHGYQTPNKIMLYQSIQNTQKKGTISCYLKPLNSKRTK